MAVVVTVAKGYDLGYIWKTQDRTARLAGHKSLFRRLLERLRPHGRQPISDSEPRPSDP